MAVATFTIALAGNPNSGKSTIFNALTGAHQHTGNWPGVTVEKKEGMIHLDGQHIAVVDLPGAYSLSAYSAEELITRDFILDAQPDVVVAVVDASNLERNLYLVVQLLEIGAPVVIALNMSDVAERRQIRIDTEKLSQRLDGIPVIPTVGNRELGVDTLKTIIARNVLERPVYPPFQILFDPEVEQEIARLEALIEQDDRLRAKYPVRWLAIKLLEEDEEILRRVRHNAALSQMATEAVARIQKSTHENADTLIVDSRYTFIAELVGGSVTRPRVETVTTSDKIDRVLAHRTWGVPIFLFFMWIVFQITANVSAPFLDWVDGLISGPVSRWAISILTVLGLQESWLEALVVDGVIAGVGGVLVFIPVLASLYFAIAVLEESGYMARAAFVMERFMLVLGLHGKSFLPMLVGFGCTVPAIYATRTLEDPLDRKITGFLTPFMSCGARLPVYVVFGAAFFGGKAGNLIFGMYATGILVAIFTSLLLTRLVFRNRTVQPFIIELPPYRIPDWRAVKRTIGDHLGQFLRHAGTVIFAASVVIWLLMATPIKPGAGKFNQIESTDSVFGSISRTVAPALEPAGFDTWEASSSLMTGLLAKEVIISTMSQIYAGGADDEEGEDTSMFVEDVEEITVTFGEATVLTGQELLNIVPRLVNVVPGITIGEADFLGQSAEADSDTALEGALRNAFTPLQAVAFNVFVLLYIPCMATVAAMRHEFGNRWMAYQALYMVVVAWIGATLVYQGGLLLGWG